MIDLSAIEYIEIDSADFAGRRFAVISNERVDAGDGALNGPIMPIPVTLLNIFGSRASIHLRGVSAYDPVSGQVTTTNPSPVQVFVYPESYTIEERSNLPEIKQGDIRVYVPGRSLGYNSVALLLLQVRDTGTSERLVA